MFFRKRTKQEQEDYHRMLEQQRQALASQFSSLGGAAAMGQGANAMGNIYPGISMASMQQQAQEMSTRNPNLHFRVEFTENGYVVYSKTGDFSSPVKAHVCTEPQEVADRILAAMVEFKMEASK